MRELALTQFIANPKMHTVLKIAGLDPIQIKTHDSSFIMNAGFDLIHRKPQGNPQDLSYTKKAVFDPIHSKPKIYAALKLLG